MKKLFIFLATMTISISSFVFAALPELQNVKLEDGVLSWDEFEGASCYYIIYVDGKTENGTINFNNQYTMIAYNHFDFKSLFERNRFNSAEYHLKLLASKTTVEELDKVTNNAIIATAISEIKEITYNYISEIPDLEAPTVLHWERYTAKWNKVENATKYQVVLYCFELGSIATFDIEDGSTEKDFFTECVPNYTYRFCVRALSDTHPNSGYSEYSSTMVNGLTSLYEMSGITLDYNNVLSWDSIKDADGYHVMITDETNDESDIFGKDIYIEGATSIDLTPYYNATNSNYINVKVYAYKNEGDFKLRISYEVDLTKIAVPEKKILGDLDNDKKITIVDVRLLLQTYINNSSYDPDICDIDDNDKLDIVDVRLLLQTYINTGNN